WLATSRADSGRRADGADQATTAPAARATRPRKAGRGSARSADHGHMRVRGAARFALRRGLGLRPLRTALEHRADSTSAVRSDPAYAAALPRPPGGVRPDS